MESEIPHFDYGISNSLDMFHKLLYDGHKLGNECDPYDCFNFFVTAWHLYDDWLPKDINRPKLALKKKGRTSGALQRLLLSFKDLADGSKHMLLKEGKFRKKTLTSISLPLIGDWLSYFSNTPRIYISVDNSRYSMWDVRYIATHYFSWLFDDNISEHEMPKIIIDHLERCIINE